MSDIFLLWTAYSPLIAILQGMTFAGVILKTRPFEKPSAVSFYLTVMGSLWFIPLIVSRFAGGATTYGLSGVGQFLLWMIFAISAGAAVAAFNRLRK